MDEDVELMLSGWIAVAVAGWVAWARHQHKKPLKPLPPRHHHHWFHKEAK